MLLKLIWIKRNLPSESFTYLDKEGLIQDENNPCKEREATKDLATKVVSLILVNCSAWQKSTNQYFLFTFSLMSVHH